MTSNRLLGVRRAWTRALFAAAATLLVVLACSPHYTFVPDNQIEHCVNGTLDADLGETDVDCGGPDCHGCSLGKICTLPSDCSEGQCLGGSCQRPGCMNGVQDGYETGVDCGGDCRGCHDGDPCTTGTDCLSNVCDPDGHCASPTCSDHVLNGDEVARDCGGAVCDGCAAGSPCNKPTDCKSGVCDPTTMTCTLVCGKNTDNCDADPTDCETNLLTDVNHCGSCDFVCDIANAYPSCVGGECQIESCVAPFARCSTDSAGCDTDLSSDAANCGACGMECPAVNGTASCYESACVVTCDDDFGDCDDDPSNGCETSLSDVENCGKCGKKCQNVDGKQAFCRDGECGATSCADGFGDCNGDGKDCEIDLDNDPLNCGRCGNVCSVVHGQPGCVKGQCVVTSCEDGFDNCNQDATDGGYSDGCEANLKESLDNCGACKNACNIDNGAGSCDMGRCVVVSCSSGFKNCDASAPDQGAGNGCETDTTSDAHNCGGCGNDCMITHAVPGCTNSRCTVDHCSGNFGDCDSDPSNGCETDVSSSIQHCGSCKGTCSKAGAVSASCTAGKCDAPTCDSSHADCDGNHANGCEIDITTASNCGACGNACDASAPTCLNIGGSYRCQSTINYVNDVEGSAQASTLSLAHTLQAGTKRLVLASLVLESTSGGRLSTVTPAAGAVTYAGIAMTAGPHQSSETGGGNQYLFFYTLTDAGGLPASGQQTLRVTGSSANVQLIAANVMEFTGVDPNTPVIGGTEKMLANPGSTCTTTGAVTTTLPGSALYTFSSAHYAGAATATGQQLLTPPTWSATVDNQLAINATYGGIGGAALAAGTYTIGFTYQWCNPAVNLPLAIVPYRQP